MIFPDYRSDKQHTMLFDLLNGGINSTTLTIIDDFCAGKLSQKVLAETERILRRRELSDGIMIFTTNVLPIRIVGTYNDQLWSRLRSMCVVVEVGGKDHRV